MSWVEKIESKLTIIMGNGNSFTLLWKNAVKVKDYNVTEFDFILTPGTFVDRREARGARYELELYFTGDDHLDEAQAFEDSADDKRPWTLSHPFYGLLIVQPLSISRDNRRYNVSLFKIIVVETLTDDNPKTTLDPVDKIESENIDLNTTFTEVGADQIVFDTDTKATMLDYNETLFGDATDKIQGDEDKDTFFNLFNQANAAVINATSAPLAALRAVQAFINYPSLLQESIENRFNIMLSQFEVMRKKIATVTTPSNKRVYENNIGVLISAMAVAVSTPFGDDDYKSGLFVLDLTNSFMNTYDQYITDLDAFQTPSGGTTQSYVPDPDQMIALNNLVAFTGSSLFNIALNQKHERNFFLEQDDNLIVLTHRLLGISADESEIDEFMRINNIGLNQILVIPKGTLITYFV